MATALTIFHVFVCVLLVLVVLLQSGKGAEISASFGGSSQTVFGTSGGANFFTKLTQVLAGLFLLTSLGLTIMNRQGKKSVMENQVQQSGASQSAPAPVSNQASSANSSAQK